MFKISTQISHSNHSTRKTALLRSISKTTPPFLCAFLIGCSTPSQPNRPQNTTVAIINTHPITTQDLWPHLAELAGQQILNELVLTHLLNTAAINHNLTITDTDIQNELHALITTLNQSTPHPPKSPQSNQSAPRLIQTIRQQRGLGPNRFNALLRRNAILRKLITTDQTLAGQIQTHIQSALAQLDTPPTPEQTKKIHHRAKLVAEQLAMETYAQNLIDQNTVLIMDRALKWSGE